MGIVAVLFKNPLMCNQFWNFTKACSVAFGETLESYTVYVHNHGVIRMVLSDLRLLKHLLIHIVHAIFLNDIVDM